MSTFNNGLYTPFEATATAAATAITPTDTIATQPLSISSLAPSPTQNILPELSSFIPTTVRTTSSPIVTSRILSSLSSTAVSSATSSRLSSVASTSIISSTTTSFIALPSATSDSNTASDPNSIKQLTPLFIIIPIILLAILGGFTYGKYWGAGATAWKAKRRMKKWGLHEEDGGDGEGLVKGRWVSDNEKDQEKGIEWMGNNSLARERHNGVLGKTFAFLSRASLSNDAASNDFAYAGVETPFMKPSASTGEIIRKAYLDRNEDQQDNERGWSWKAREPSFTELSSPKRGIDEHLRKPLSPGWKWAARRYRPKHEGGSVSSRSSETSFGTLGSILRGVRKKEFMPMNLDEEQRHDGSPPSPSVYSPPTEHATNDEDLNQLLGQSRVGNSGLANRFLTGTLTSEETESFSQAQSQQIRSGYKPVANFDPVGIESEHQGFRMEVELPAAPTRTHVSPKKSTVRGLKNPITPTKTQNQLLFSYNSPKDSPIRPRPPREYHSPASDRSVGVPMPNFEAGQVRESDSTLSLNNGIRAIIFGEEQKRRESGKMRVPVPRDMESNVPRDRQSKSITLEQVEAIVTDRSIAQHSRNSVSMDSSPLLPILPSTPPKKSIKLPIPAALPLSPPLAPFSPALPLPPSPTKGSRVRAAVEELEIRTSSPNSIKHNRSSNAADAIGHREELEQASIAILLKKRSKLSVKEDDELNSSPLESSPELMEIRPLNLTRRTNSTPAAPPSTNTRPDLIRSSSIKTVPKTVATVRRPKSSNDISSNTKSKPGSAGLIRPTSVLISNTNSNRSISPAQLNDDIGEGTVSRSGWDAMLKKSNKDTEE